MIDGVALLTTLFHARRSEAGLLGTPGDGWDVGWATAFLASDEARWISGVTLPVESGVLAVTPLMMAPYLRAIPDPRGGGYRRGSPQVGAIAAICAILSAKALSPYYKELIQFWH